MNESLRRRRWRVLGRADALPILNDAAAERSQAASVAACLPGLLWEERVELFNRLVSATISPDELAHVATSFATVSHPQTAHKLWGSSGRFRDGRPTRQGAVTSAAKRLLPRTRILSTGASDAGPTETSPRGLRTHRPGRDAVAASGGAGHPQRSGSRRSGSLGHRGLGTGLASGRVAGGRLQSVVVL